MHELSVLWLSRHLAAYRRSLTSSTQCSIASLLLCPNNTSVLLLQELAAFNPVHATAELVSFEADRLQGQSARAQVEQVRGL